jgi:hypothetical protein
MSVDKNVLVLGNITICLEGIPPFSQENSLKTQSLAVKISPCWFVKIHILHGQIHFSVYVYVPRQNPS